MRSPFLFRVLGNAAAVRVAASRGLGNLADVAIVAVSPVPRPDLGLGSPSMYPFAVPSSSHLSSASVVARADPCTAISSLNPLSPNLSVCHVPLVGPIPSVSRTLLVANKPDKYDVKRWRD